MDTPNEHNTVVTRQFGPQASAYLTSANHARASNPGTGHPRVAAHHGRRFANGL